MDLTIDYMNGFSVEVLEMLYKECNVTFMINDGHITDIGYMFE